MSKRFISAVNTMEQHVTQPATCRDTSAKGREALTELPGSKDAKRVQALVRQAGAKGLEEM